MPGDLYCLAVQPITGEDVLYAIAPTLRLCHCAAEGIVVGQYQDWGVTFDCPTSVSSRCSRWLSCFKCTGNTKRFTTRASINGHQKRKHDHPRKRKQLERAEETSTSVEGDFGIELGEVMLSEELDADMPPASESSCDCNQDDRSKFGTVFDPTTDLEVDWTNCDNPPTTVAGGGQASSAFLYHQHYSQGDSGGAEYLVKKSLLQHDLQPAELAKIDIPRPHIDLQLKIAKMAFMTARTNRGLLADIISACYKIGCEDGYHTSGEILNTALNKKVTASKHTLLPPLDFVLDSLQQPFKQELVVKRAHAWSTPIPSCNNDFRKYHLEGVHAIVPNLPYPTIRLDLKGHAYLSLVDCLEDFMAHHQNEEIEAITKSTVGNQSVAATLRCQSLKAKNIFDNTESTSGTPVLVVGLTFWSDDAETNTFSKTNRNSSIWVKTFSICTVSAKGQQLRATYPIAVGRKNLCHDPVEHKHQEELDLLQHRGCHPYYVGSRKQFAHIQFSLFATLQDQPEKRSGNKLMLGNSQYHARWGWSADHRALYRKGKLMPCSNCIENMANIIAEREFHRELPRCDRCLNFDVSAQGNLGLTDLPINYPIFEDRPVVDCCPPWINRVAEINGERKLKPFPITYAGLRVAVDTAHHYFCHHGWTTGNCDAFLRVEGLCASYIERVIDHARNASALKNAQENNPDDSTGPLEDFRRSPHLYEQCPYSPNWQRLGVLLTDTVDAPMHLLFLNLVKTCVLKIQEWLLAQQRNAPFVKSNAPFLLGFLHMHIEWLHLLPYKGKKFGGWVSENFLGFSRLIKWFYQNIGESVPEQDDDAPPEGLPQHKWLARHNKFWLKARGLQHIGSAIEIRKRVAETMKKDGNFPRPVSAPNLVLSQVEDVLLALSDVLECIMDRNVTNLTSKKAGLLIKWLIYKYDTLDRALSGNIRSPDVIAKYSFMCLMNVPLMIETFGALRNLWEGGWRGEGILQKMKPLVTQGLKHKWEGHLLAKMLRSRALDALLIAGGKTGELSLFSEDALRKRSRQFHKYESQLDLVDSVNHKLRVDEKLPVSVILVDCNSTVVLYGVVGDYGTLVRIDLVLTTPPTKKMGLFYYTLTAASNGVVYWKNILKEVTSLRLGYAVLLPLMDTQSSGEESCRYAVVASNWHSLAPELPIAALIDGDIELSQ